VRAHRGGEIAAGAGTAPKRFRDPEAGRRIQDLGDAVPLDQFQAAGLRCPGPVVMVHSTANVDVPSPEPLSEGSRQA